MPACGVLPATSGGALLLAWLAGDWLAGDWLAGMRNPLRMTWLELSQIYILPSWSKAMPDMAPNKASRSEPSAKPLVFGIPAMVMTSPCELSFLIIVRSAM